MKHIIRISMLCLSIFFMSSLAFAATPLPPSDWYTVAWVESTDTLHWINAQGEQASIPRPTLEGEISQAQTRLQISPNGRWLVIISPLNNGREGIGFFDLENGQFSFVHETQQNEIVTPVRGNPFTKFSNRIALTLKDNTTNAWRILVFDSATGNALHQLTWQSDILPKNLAGNDAWTPSVAHFNYDEGVNSSYVRFLMVPTNNAAPESYPSFVWVIPPGQNPEFVNSDNLQMLNPFAGFDILPMSGQRVFAEFDLQFGNPASASDANSIYTATDESQNLIASEGAGSARLPRWLNNGNWIGYYGTNGAFAPHWTVVDPVAQMTLPIAPDISDVYHVSDGFLTKHTGMWRLNHVTGLNHEAFAEPIGNTIFQPGSAFAVIYTTPPNTAFQLTAVENITTDNNLDVAVNPNVPECPPAPPVRLAVGDSARVTFTDGTSLNVRTAPAGDFIMQVPEGTQATIIEGPVCADGYQWFNLDFGNGTGGWAAEGDPEDYFLEPFEQLDIAVQPTPTPELQIAQVPTATPELQIQQVPTATPELQIAVQPTATTPIIITVNCVDSAPPQLEVGMMAQTIQNDGTLAMRINLEDEFPTYQVPSGVTMQIIDGPKCRTTVAGVSLTNWKVRLTLNGQQVEGWLAESVGNTYYIVPQ